MSNRKKEGSIGKFEIKKTILISFLLLFNVTFCCRYLEEHPFAKSSCVLNETVEIHGIDEVDGINGTDGARVERANRTNGIDETESQDEFGNRSLSTFCCENVDKKRHDVEPTYYVLTIIVAVLILYVIREFAISIRSEFYNYFGKMFEGSPDPKNDYSWDVYEGDWIRTRYGRLDDEFEEEEPEIDDEENDAERPKIENADKKKSVGITDEKIIKESNNNDDDEIACKICFENKRKCAAVPCGHYAVCYSCSVRLSSECCICKQNVEKYIVVYQ
jgi:hypothetical protein